MAYEQVKVYFDGSHFIGIPHTESQRKTGGKSKVSKEKKEVFEKAYNDTMALDKTVRQQAIVDNIDKRIHNLIIPMRYLIVKQFCRKV